MAKILLIEDNESQATFQAYQLWNAGHEVEITHNGRDALKKLDTSNFDLILMDHELPDISGLELFRIIKGNNPEEAIIMVTGKGNESLAAQVLKEGAKDYLVKSKQVMETLPHVVDQVLREERIRHELDQKEKALKEAYASLEQKVLQRTAELEILNNRLLSEIQERRKAEEALKKSQEIYRVLVENAYEGIGILQNGRFLFVNPRLIEILECSYEDIITRNFFDYLHPDDRPMVRQRHEARIRGDEIANLYPFRIITTSGCVKWLLLSVVAIVWEEDYAELCFFTDITEGRQAEEEKEILQKQLQQAQKMEAIGTLAGGIAHDFNNILGAIIGNAELAQIKIEKSNQLKGNIDQIIKAANRAAGLVAQILTFSRKAEQKLSHIDVRPIIKESVKFLRSSIPTTIDIQINIETEECTILADPTQIHQVVMNLCANAAHAMSNHGDLLAISLHETLIEPDSVDVPVGLLPGRYLTLTVRDNGQGMDSSTVERIFEPYYTTKEPGEGTGLGLAVVHGIVTNHNGVIIVHSEPHKGSRFDIYFPITHPAADGDIFSQSLPIPIGVEHILYVDDEEALVDMSRQLLERLGYRVTPAQSSHQAVRLFKKEPDQYDLVITDQTMPKMTGLEMAVEMMRIRPNLPVILCTGYSRQVNADMARTAGIKRFLMKPLNLREMAVAIREALDDAPVGSTKKAETNPALTPQNSFPDSKK